MKRNAGQSLVEVLVGLAIGALLIGAASMAIAFVLRAGSTTQTLTTATQLSQDLMSKVRSLALADWNGIYDLNHGSTSTYFLVASSTGFIAVPGEEGAISNNIKDGLIGHWGFDAATGTIAYDESGNGNNGTLSCAGTGCSLPQWTTGKVGGALNFISPSPSVYSRVLIPSTVPTSSQITVTAWYKWNGDTGDDRIINRGWCSSMGWLMHRTYGFGVNNGTGCSAQYLASFGGVTQGQWTFLAGVFDGSTVYAYKNGILTATSTSSGVNLGLNNYAIDMMSQDNGLLDDVRIYNRALSAGDIGELYNSSVFRRYFYVDDVCRAISGTSSLPIASSTPNPACGGGYFNDPSTQKITAVTEWDAAGKTSNFSLINYVTRWANYVFDQKDWSGGGGQDGVFSVPSNQYASATNITATSSPFGSIQLENLSQQ